MQTLLNWLSGQTIGWLISVLTNVQSCALATSPQQHTCQLQHVQSTVAMQTYQRRDLELITKDFKSQKKTGKSSATAIGALRFNAGNFEYTNQRNNPSTIQISCRSTSRICSTVLVPHLRQDRHKIDEVQRSKQWWFKKSETTATAIDSRTWNSSALYKEDYKDS